MSIPSNFVVFYQSPMLLESNQRALVISENHLNSIARKSAAGHDEFVEKSARKKRAKSDKNLIFSTGG
ncbi:MAG: hypothetical protein ACPG7M_01240 [Paracoccaceae bacterium]